MEEGEVKKIMGEWYVYIEDDFLGENDEGECVGYSGWLNIDQAVKKIKEIESKPQASELSSDAEKSSDDKFMRKCGKHNAFERCDC